MPSIEKENRGLRLCGCDSRGVLMVSASYGTGHDRIAKAVGERLAELGIETKFSQVYGYAPRLVKRKSKIHRFVHRRIPAVYHYFWSGEADRVRTCMPRRMYRSFRKPATYLEKVVKDFQPAAIFCTHLYGGAAIARLRKEGRISPRIRVYSILTEFCVYPNWEANNTLDGVFLPCEDLIPAFLERGYRSEQLIVCGLPVRPRFASIGDREHARAALGLENRFTLLCLSGGECLSGNLDPIRTLSRAGCFPQIVAICGTNKKEYRRIAAYVRKNRLSNVRIYGFVENIDVMIDAADVVLSRGGFGTLSELLVKGAGILLREKLIVQEKRNAEYLCSKGAAVALSSLADLPDVLRGIEENGTALSEQKERALRLSDSNGIDNICHILLREQRQ